MSEFNEFVGNQSRIFNNFRVATANLLQSGVEIDAGGVAPQSAFLVSWRYPESLTSLVAEFSEEASSTLAEGEGLGALTYGPENAHTTISDYQLQRDVLINPEQNDTQAAILENLVTAVRRGLDARKRSEEYAVRFGRPLTNGKTAIIPGVPLKTVWAMNRSIVAESAMALAPEAPLKGTWGNHMTVARFLVAHEAGAPATRNLKRLVTKTRAFGKYEPTTIDVGYFNTDPANGFVLTTTERFEVTGV